MSFGARDARRVPAEPCFCPRCKRLGSGDGPLCPDCGETRLEAGCCAICEAPWPLPVGAVCPKHEVELERHAPSSLGGGLAAAPVSRWVTVATFADPLRAEAPRIRLEAEGVPTFLVGERMGSRSMYQVATGGVQLQVPEPLAADARVLLSQTWTLNVEDDLDDAWDELAPEPGAARRAVMKGLIVFLLVAPLVLTLLSLLLER